MSTYNDRNKTLEAIRILDSVAAQTNSFLNTINAAQVGHKELVDLFEQIRGDINDAMERSKTETLRLGILGGTGSGKSSLANALMGDNYLPESAIIFCTNLPTTIKHSRKTFLGIESDLKEYAFEKSDISAKDIKERLKAVCKESENPNNTKKITRITIGLDQDILDGKEIVDVPGFTRGNPLHQAFAERYAKHYCDVCVVLLNNSASVEIGNYQGLEALARCFADRLDSTVFVINKCDESQQNDINYVKNQLRNFLPGQEPVIYELSAKNWLAKRGEQFEQAKFVGKLTYFSTRRNLILVRASIGRLISNFASLRDLCRLTQADLEEIHKNLQGLLVTGIKEYEAKLKRNLSREQVLPETIPSLDISAFDIPLNSLGVGPNEYAQQLIESIKSQLTVLDEFVQKHEANIYRGYNSQYETEIENFGETLHSKVQEFEKRFKIPASIEVPKVEYRLRRMNFDPAKIERLKPFPFRRWLERTLPGILVRDVKFWLSPLSISFGGLSMKIGLPIGVESAIDMTLQFREDVPKDAIRIMNEYLYNSLDSFVRQLQNEYTEATQKFVKDWEKCLRDYIRRIETAKTITSPESQRKFDGLIKDLRQSHEKVGTLISLD